MEWDYLKRNPLHQRLTISLESRTDVRDKLMTAAVAVERSAGAAEDLESIEATLELLADTQAQERIRRAERRYAYH